MLFKFLFLFIMTIYRIYWYDSSNYCTINNLIIWEKKRTSWIPNWHLIKWRRFLYIIVNFAFYSKLNFSQRSFLWHIIIEFQCHPFKGIQFWTPQNGLHFWVIPCEYLWRHVFIPEHIARLKLSKNFLSF